LTVPVPVNYYINSSATRFLNNRSEVLLVGHLKVFGTLKLATWSPTEGIAYLPDPPAAQRPDWSATAMNDARMVALNTNSRAYVHSDSAGYQQLSSVGEAYTYDLNSAGHAAGSILADTVGAYFTAVVWRTPSDRIALPVPAGVHVEATHLNDTGFVAGAVYGTTATIPIAWLPVSAPPNPSQSLTGLSSSLATFIQNGLISPNDGRGLTASISATGSLLAAANTRAAKNTLAALSNQVDALVRSGRVSQSTATALQNAILQKSSLL
jgi:hypothetical protein